jgi:hypothetical protein
VQLARHVLEAATPTGAGRRRLQREPARSTLWLHRSPLNSTPQQASLSEEQTLSHQSPSCNAVSRPQLQLSRPSQRRQPTASSSRPLPPQPTGIPPPHREHRLKLRITQAVYVQSVSIKGAYHAQPSINCGDMSPHIGDLWEVLMGGSHITPPRRLLIRG